MVYPVRADRVRQRMMEKGLTLKDLIRKVPGLGPVKAQRLLNGEGVDDFNLLNKLQEALDAGMLWLEGRKDTFTSYTDIVAWHTEACKNCPPEQAWTTWEPYVQGYRDWLLEPTPESATQPEPTVDGERLGVTFFALAMQPELEMLTPSDLRALASWVLRRAGKDRPPLLTQGGSPKVIDFPSAKRQRAKI